MDVWNEQHVYFETHFHLVDVLALFVQKKSGDIDRHLRVDGTGALLHCFLLNDAQDM